VSRITETHKQPSYGSKMAHTHTCNLLHCVFSTKERANLISDPARLWKYTGGITRQKQVLLLAAGGTSNHLHLLISLPPTMMLAKVVQELKGNTSRWLNEVSPPFAWQEGYSAFSVSQSQRKVVIDYIDNQAEHHAKWTFEQEFLALLKKSGIPYDERFVFG
jgi:putative transposase